MCVWITSLCKYVVFWTQDGFGYGYGGRFRGPNQEHLDKVALKVNGNFETGGRRTALGIIAICVEDLLISGISEFIGYIYRGAGVGAESKIRCGYLCRK